MRVSVPAFFPYSHSPTTVPRAGHLVRDRISLSKPLTGWNGLITSICPQRWITLYQSTSKGSIINISTPPCLTDQVKLTMKLESPGRFKSNLSIRQSSPHSARREIDEHSLLY